MIEWSTKLYKMISERCVDFCVENNISPTLLTITNHVMTLTLGVYFFSLGVYAGWIAGLAICFINGFLDYLDGDVAKRKGQVNEFGIWIDSGFDVIVQNFVMAAIAVGCFKMGLSIYWIAIFFVGNSASNFISFNYNEKFGFDSYRGNELFRDYMDRKRSYLNIFLKNMIDPTQSGVALFLYTFRYFILYGCLLNIMPQCFIIITILLSFRWVTMLVVYSLYLTEEKDFHVLQALAVLDEARDEFYKLRHSKKV